MKIEITEVLRHVFTCPDCEYEITLDDLVLDEGEIVSCSVCGEEYEVENIRYIE